MAEIRPGKRAVFVNGLPATGKTSIARRLADARGWPVLTLDSIKEPFFDAVGIGDREHNRALGRAAMTALFAVIGDAPAGATFVIDAWFGVVPKERLDALIAAAGVVRTAEIWCHAPGALLAERYVARADKRHPGHPGPEYADELARRAETVVPVAVGPVHAVDTSLPVDWAALDGWLDGVFGTPTAAANG